MTDTRRDLPVPDASLDAFRRLCSQVEPQWTREQRVQQIAAPVVAAVLSDIADRMDADGLGEAAGWLRVRAGEYGGAG